MALKVASKFVIIILTSILILPIFLFASSDVVFGATDLDFYVNNFNGNPVTDGKAFVKRYSASWTLIDQVSTDNSGKATWTNVQASTYNFETYYSGAGGQEYWGDVSLTVGSSSVSYSFVRFMPFCSVLWIGDNQGNSRTSFNAGEIVRAKFTVKNNVAFALSCSVNATWDQDQVAPWDFNQTTSASQIVGYGGSKDYSLDYAIPIATPSTTMRLAYCLWTQLLNGNTVMTDSWVWTTSTISITPVQLPEKSFVALQFDTESDAENMGSGFVSPLVLSMVQDIGDLLQSKGVPATFFVQGACFDNSQSGSNFTREIYALMGQNEIGSHFYSHLENMSVEDVSTISAELSKTEKAAGMKFFGARVPYFDVSDQILAQLSASGYVYDSDVWVGGDNVPYQVTVYPNLKELPWRCSDHDTTYSAIKGVLDNYVTNKSNMTIVFHPEYVADDWAGFSQLIQAVSDYQAQSKISVLTSLQVVNEIFHISLANLAVTPVDIKLVPTGTPNANSVSLKSVVHNIGGSDANNFLVKFYEGNPAEGGTQIGTSVQIGQLKGGLSTMAETSWATQGGSHNIYVAVNPNEAVEEEDKTNNVACSSIFVNFSSNSIVTPPPTNEVTPLPTDSNSSHTSHQFSPTTDGFQFGNNIPKDSVSYSDALSRLNSAVWAGQIPVTVRPVFAMFSVAVNQLQMGNCFGMTYTAKYYFENQGAFELHYPGLNNMYSVSQAAVQSEILVNQFPGQEIMHPFVFNLALTYLRLNSLNDEVGWIISQCDANKVVQLYLTKRETDPLFFHSVIVYDYEQNGNRLVLKIYDPNHSGATSYITLVKDQKGDYSLERTGKTGDSVVEYGLSNIGTGEYPNINWASLSAHTNELVQLVWSFLPRMGTGVLAVKVECPVNVMVRSTNGLRTGFDPSTGQIISEIPGAFYSGNETEPQVIIVPSQEGDSYQIFLSGTTQGNYTLTVKRYNQGEIVGSPLLASGSAQDGMLKDYAVSLSGNSLSWTEVQPKIPQDYSMYVILGAVAIIAGILAAFVISAKRKR
jgi:hypothetical protein